MTTLVETLAVKLVGDTADYTQKMDEADRKWGDVGKSMTSTGMKMTGAVTLPIIGIGGAAIKMSTDFNASMANVASLGLVPERVEELKSGVQNMAIEVGKSTGDLAGGLYQVVSAFGDTADTATILEINAKAAAAGLATTEEAIALTSAVTKGYGDSSAEAVQKVADLAFETVKLGQTTFPELAASMGKVVPIASALGVSQEELFAQMATLTGVTGGAAEVSTQLRAVYQGLLKPTAEMANSLDLVARELDEQGKLAGGPMVDQWKRLIEVHREGTERFSAIALELENVNTETEEGAKRAKELEKALKDQKTANKENYDAIIEQAGALGTAIVESVGLTEAVSLLSETAGGNTDQLGKMFGSVEALGAVLALSGGQAETFAEKSAAMSDVTGSAGEAFAAQTEGINKSGFEMEQAAVKMQVMTQKLGDGLAPALLKVLDIVSPWIDKLVELADRFANADSGTQTWITALVGLVAAVGPVLMALGGMVSMISGAAGIVSAIGSAGAALAALLGPIGWVALAIGALVIAWNTDFMGLQTNTKAGYANMVRDLTWFRDEVVREWDGLGENLTTGSQNMMEDLHAAWQWGQDVLKDITSGGMELVKGAFRLHVDAIKAIFDLFDWFGIGDDVVAGIVDGINAGLDWVRNAARNLAQSAIDAAKNALGISSPSEVMASEVGEPAAAGVIEGWKRGLRDVETGFGMALDGIVSGMAGRPAVGAGSISVVIHQTFNGSADERTVRGASEQGVLAALRQVGLR